MSAAETIAALERAYLFLRDHSALDLAATVTEAQDLLGGKPWWVPIEKAEQERNVRCRVLLAVLGRPRTIKKGKLAGRTFREPYVTIGRWVPLGEHPEGRDLPAELRQEIGETGGYWGRPGRAVPGTVMMFMHQPALPDFDDSLTFPEPENESDV